MRERVATLVIGGLISIAWIGAAAAGKLDEGLTAYRNGDYGTALQLLQPLAEKGVVTAQIDLGIMYRFGRGVPKDDTQAAAWLRRAADHGSSYAQSQLRAMNADAPDASPQLPHRSTKAERAAKSNDAKTNDAKTSRRQDQRDQDERRRQ